jgi:DNA-binding transcriptional MerR regulator
MPTHVDSSPSPAMDAAPGSAAAAPHGATVAGPEAPVPGERLLRIQEVAAEVGTTARAIRYYEEVGLLRPAARSQGAYRLYDASDVERLRFIRGLRDDAGFSLAEIGRLLEDEDARARARARFRATDDPDERRALALDALERTERRIATLRHKAERLAAMIEEAEGRRSHLIGHLAEIDAADR